MYYLVITIKYQVKVTIKQAIVIMYYSNMRKLKTYYLCTNFKSLASISNISNLV